MKSKKILIVVIIIMAMLAVGGGVLAYLLIATDTFKSDKELFAKYANQNIETLQNLKNSQTIQKYKELKNQKKYESNTDLKVTYSEGGEVSNPFNNLAAKLDIQKDDEYMYMDGQILYNQEEYLESEIIKDGEIHGIRFSDVAKQFISIKDDENLEKVANDIGVDTKTLQNIINTIDGTVPITNGLITEDEAKSLKDKYLSMITEAISNGTFSSNKKSMITYNDKTINTKAYAVTLSSDQVEKLLVEILNNIKTETVITNYIKDESFGEKIDSLVKSITEEQEVPVVKITVFQQKKKTIRTVIEIGLNKIVIENSEENGQMKSNIQITKADTEKTIEYNIELTKATTENKEDISAIANITNGDEKYSISLETGIKYTDKSIDLSAIASYKKDILTASIKLDNSTNLSGNIEKKQVLDQKNNITLNDTGEEQRKNIIQTLKTNVPAKFQKRVGLLSNALIVKKEETPTEEVPDDQMSQVEINKFNAKFEFYTGNEVSAENVKTLLNTVKDNLGSYEIKLDENQENTDEMDESEKRYNIKLSIERNKKDENGIKQVLKKINDDKKYKISITYKEENKLIDYIMIEEVYN